VAWYKEWFGEAYLDLYSHRNSGEAERHVDFVERLIAEEKPTAVLDLACGAGRHTAALRERSIRALGIDLSLTLLTRGVGLPRVCGDMRALPFAERSFDLVLNFFTSFGYFETERENFRVLEEMVRILRPGGRVLVDLFNTDVVLAGLKASEEQEIGGRRVGIERWYDAGNKRINKRIRLFDEGVGEGKAGKGSFLESVRAYRRDEVVIGMQWAGLEVEGVYGNFEGEDFSPTSERLILVARRPADRVA